MVAVSKFICFAVHQQLLYTGYFNCVLNIGYFNNNEKYKNTYIVNFIQLILGPLGMFHTPENILSHCMLQ